jgi:DNA repair exonuclease SbcCD nuclease subunit
VRERKRELVATFQQTVDRALMLGASGYIIAGDLFDTEKVTRSTVENIMAIIEKVPQLTFFYLFGNHEKRMLIESGVAIPRNLKIFDDGWTYFRLDDVVIAGRCETSKDMFATLSLEPGKRNIVVLHGELCDRSDEGGAIGVKEIEGLPIDYLALGHYHTYGATSIGQRCTAVYSGIPEGRGFDEVGEKGVVMLDVDKFGIRHEFIKTAKRTLRIVNADVGGLLRGVDVEEAVARAISGIDRGDLVRLMLVGEREITTALDTDAIYERFKDRFYYFEVKDATRVRISADDFKNDRSLKGEFIRSVIADESISDDMKEKIITTGLRALLGENID